MLEALLFSGHSSSGIGLLITGGTVVDTIVLLPWLPSLLTVPVTDAVVDVWTDVLDDEVDAMFLASSTIL